MLEPVRHVAHVPVQELRAARIGYDVDDLRQVDQDQLTVVDEQVVGGQVAMRQPGVELGRGPLFGAGSFMSRSVGAARRGGGWVPAQVARDG